MKIKYKIIDFLFSEDVGDLIYCLDNGRFNECRKIIKFFEGLKK